MKKLITLLSAATVAIGLYAYTDTGTSFEGLTAGEIDITTTTDDLPAGAGGSGFWATNGSANVTLTVKEQQRIRQSGDSLSALKSTVPQFLNQDPDIEQINYLSIQTTFGNAVTRKVKSDGGLQSMGDQFYFDSLVKFTAFDEDPMTTAVAGDFTGAKIAVWAQEVEVNGNPQTNVFVRAGYIGGEVQNYDCGFLDDPEGWHRLTIKAIKDVYQDDSNVTCFVVFIDGQSIGDVSTNKKGLTSALEGGKYAGFYNTGVLFPSMIQDVVGSTSLASVSFDGQGDIDDVVFTETPPFDAAKDGDNAVATFNGQAFADVAALATAVDAASAEVLAATSVKFFSDTTDSFETETVYPYTVDLNGKSIGGLVSAAVVTLIDSSDPQTGKVDGWLGLAGGSILNAGKFLKSENGPDATDFSVYVLPKARPLSMARVMTPITMSLVKIRSSTSPSILGSRIRGRLCWRRICRCSRPPTFLPSMVRVLVPTSA